MVLARREKFSENEVNLQDDSSSDLITGLVRVLDQNQPEYGQLLRQRNIAAILLAVVQIYMYCRKLYKAGGRAVKIAADGVGFEIVELARSVGSGIW